MNDFWQRELEDIDFDGLGDPPGPPDFGTRLAEHQDFCAIASGFARRWGSLDKAGRSLVQLALVNAALEAVPEAETPADAQAIGLAIIEALRRAAARAFADGDVTEETLREIVGLPSEASLRAVIGAAIVVQASPEKPKAPALRYPPEYYLDAVRFTLKAWARRWWPGLDPDQDHDRLLQRRKRARRTARRCLDEADRP